MKEGVMPEGPLWRITLFGGVRIENGAEVITRFRSQNIAGVLAYLALKPGQSYSREHLGELFWPDADPSAARTNLRTALASLRRQLEPPGVAAGSVLVSSGQSQVELSPGAVAVDVEAFARLFKIVSRPATPPEERRQRLREAVALYRGPLLPGFYDSWALAERDRLAQRYCRALQQLIDLEEKAGELSAALDLARQLVAADPASEEAHATVIRLLMATDQERAARLQLKELERRLDEEFGTEPAPATRALLRRDRLTSSRFLSPAAPTAAAFAASAPQEYNGKSSEIGASETAASGSSAAVATPTPTPPSPPSPPAPRKTVHLPLSLTRFFGREQEVSRIREALCREGVRLLTLTGPGGTGKTRLAVEAARRLSLEFPGGIWFVSLAHLQNADELFDVIHKVLGLPSAPGVKTEESVAAALEGKAAAGSVLLVIDNFEQVVDSGAGHVKTLLNRVRALSCLVTSRQRLMLEGEQELPIRPLPTPNHTGTPELLMEFPSVQLFVSRAQAARSDFQLTPRNAAVVADLCTRLEGIPLAIELSAAWSQTLTPAQMLERLNHRFDLLISRRRDISERHTTLRATIDWSYRLLTADLQRFFAQLSFFRGGWTLEAAEAVSEEPLAMAFLAELCDRSLLVAEESHSGAMRYRMLESMREFAEERLSESDAPVARRRHIEYFLRLAETAAEHILGSSQAEWLNRLEEDHDNLRYLLACLAVSDSDTDKEAHLRLATTLSRFWMVRGYFTEGRRHLAAALEQSGSAAASLRVLALGAAGNLAGAQGDRTAAQHYLEACRNESCAIGDAPGLSQALSGLGNLALNRGSFAEAKTLYQEALQLHRQTGNTRGAGRTLMMLGNVSGNEAKFETARGFYQESLALCQQVGDQAGIALVYQNLGVITARQGEMQEAFLWYEKSLSLRRELNDLPGLAATLETLGTTARKLGDHDAATRYYEESFALRRQMQDRTGTMLLRLNLALAAVDRGDVAEAATQVRESLVLIRESGNDRYLPYVLETYALVTALRNEPERSANLWGAADTLRAAIHSPGAAAEIAERAAQMDAVSRTMPDGAFVSALEQGRALSLEEALAMVAE